jgi:rhodanese-related sulfurtransferase
MDSVDSGDIRIGVAHARRKLEAGGALALDVVQPGPWAQLDGAIEGAPRIPPDEVTERFQELPLDRDVIVYCT